MTPFDRAMQAVEVLAPEDVLLLTQTIVARLPYGAWISLFNLCRQDDVDGLFMRLWVESGPAARAEMLWVLLERAFDYVDMGEVRRMGQWLEASLRPKA